jgi:glycosyltransferase involved in cell wall biosynthesis
VSGFIALVSPTFWGKESAIGGGERYVHELAHALAKQRPVRWITYGNGPTRRESLAPALERIVLRRWAASNKWSPFSPRLGSFLRGAAVVHAFQYYTLPAFQSLAWAGRHRVPAFCTDLGGGGWTPGYQIDQSRWMTAHLPLSNYAARHLPGMNKSFRVLWGGVDTTKFRPRPELTHDGSVVFLGRILRHKGIHLLIEAMPEDVPLSVLGASGDDAYLAELRRAAIDKKVTFALDASDEQIVDRLRRAALIVHPTPIDQRGDAGANELLGLAPLEGMACGCVPILSNAASLPELIEDGVSGRLVAPNDSAALGRAIVDGLTANSGWREMSQAATSRVAQQFSWPRTAARCVDAYEVGR